MVAVVIQFYRASRSGPAAPVMTGPDFSRKTNEISFLQKQVINKSTCASVNFGLVTQKSISRSTTLLAAHKFSLLLCSQGILLYKMLSKN